jgi:hypothetical protein
MIKPKPTNADGGAATRSSRRNPSRILGDGTSITQEAYESADLELHAFFRLNRLRYDASKMTVGVMPVPLEIIFKPQPATSRKLLDLIALSRANDDLKHNALLPLNPKRHLKPKESFYAQQSPAAFLRFRFDRHKAVLRECLASLAKRKAGWTLLRITKKRALGKLIAECFSQRDASWVKDNGVILSQQLVLLLARKNILQRGDRTVAMRSKTSKERSEDAKKGWKSRKTAGKPNP